MINYRNFSKNYFLKENAGSMGRQRGGIAPAPHPHRWERQLGPSGRPTQQEPFASRSREKPV